MKKLYTVTILLLLVVQISAQTETAFDIKLGTAIPIIKFADIYEAGFSASVGYLYSFSKQTQITLHTGYYSIPFDNEKYNLKYADFENNERFDFEAPLTAIPFTIGIRYYLTDKNVRPYVLADAGFYYYSQKLTGSYIENGVTVPAPPLEKSAFSSTFSAGFGLTYPISELVVFDFVGKFNGFINTNALNSAGNNSSARTVSNTLYTISILAGINYYLEN